MLPNAGFPNPILNSLLLRREGFLKASFYVGAKCKENSRPPTKPFPKAKNAKKTIYDLTDEKLKKKVIKIEEQITIRKYCRKEKSRTITSFWGG